MKYIILLSFFLSSCGPVYNCDLIAEDLKKDECLLIVEKIPSDTDDRFDYKGINSITKKKCDCNSYRSDRWWATYKEHIEIGDTIIKRKGELIFSIHKKDTILNFNWECDGKVGNVYSVKNKFKIDFFINKSGSVSKLVMTQIS